MEMNEAWPDTYKEGYIYINFNLDPLAKVRSSSRDTKFRDICPWNIYQIITKTVLISTRIVIRSVMKRDIPYLVWWKVTLKTETWSEFSNGGSEQDHSRTITGVERKKEIQKRGCHSLHQRRKVNHLLKFILVWKNYNRVFQAY